MIDLVILAAGKGSRMNSHIPKALHIIDEEGTNNMQNTINMNTGLFQNIFVVVNSKDKELFEKEIHGATVLGINSGLGSGHAVFETIKKYKLSDDFILVWGDAVFMDNKLSKELINYPSEHTVIPIYKTQNPYISFKVTEDLQATSVDFSKYGETNETGLQDKCIFRLNKKIINSTLKLIHQATFKNGRYITESKEFEFLYFVHAMAAADETIQCYITEYNDSIFSYNTQDELNKIMQKTQ